jgi:hypothetical protein
MEYQYDAAAHSRNRDWPADRDVPTWRWVSQLEPDAAVPSAAAEPPRRCRFDWLLMIVLGAVLALCAMEIARIFFYA